MTLKFKQYIDIYDLPEKVKKAIMDYTRDAEYGGQDTLLRFDIEMLEEHIDDEDDYVTSVGDSKIILDFLRDNDLSELGVHLWW